MLAQIISLIVDTLGSLFVYLLLLRFHMQWTRAPFRNPVGEMIAGLTNWLVLPARRFIPGLLGLDMATLLLAWLAQGLITVLLMSLQGHNLGNPGMAVVMLASVSAVELLIMSIYLLIGAAIVQAILSFISPYSVLAPVLDALTRPFYKPFRRFIPPLGGIDLSPLFLVLAAQIAIMLLRHLVRTLGL